MMNLSDTITSPHLYSAVVVLLIVVAIKAVIGLFVTQDPMAYFRFYCQRLADKVSKSTNSVRQQQISGLIAILVTLVPLVTILWLFETFIEVTWLWQGLLLYFALGSFGLTRINKNIAKELVANNNYQAKQLLAPYVLRDTNKLSSLGLSKACIEAQLLRASQQLVCVGFYYLAFGPLTALSYRLLLEMHYSWNVKSYGFQYFGASVNHIVKLLQWLPSRLFAIVIFLSSAGQNSLLSWRLTQNKFFQLGNSLLLHALALALEIRLSGVAMYQGAKLRKPAFNEQARQAQATDIIHASRRINFALYLCLLFIMMAAILSYASVPISK